MGMGFGFLVGEESGGVGVGLYGVGVDLVVWGIWIVLVVEDVVDNDWVVDIFVLEGDYYFLFWVWC